MKNFKSKYPTTICFMAMVALALSCSKKGSGGGGGDVTPPDKPKDTIDLTPSPIGDVVGKVIVGYQGWFAAIGDGSPINLYWHWANTWEQEPSPTNTAISSWPDVRAYTSTYPTQYPNLNNGSPANVFSSF